MKLLIALIALLVTSLAVAQPYAGVQKATAEDKKTLAAKEKAYASAKAMYVKKPNDAKVKKAYAAAAANYGYESMISPVLDRSVKYRQALRLFREAMKIEPNHPLAKPASDKIIQIYKSLGRPVPKD
ncbi:MAG: hypothetical protein ACAH95_09690 [Fimbriimonas sp.]